MKGCESLVVRAGQPAKFDVKIGGEPPPDVFWFKGEQALAAGQNVSIDTKKQENTVLTIKACKRSDGGKYKLTVKNNLGEASGVAELTVLGKFSVSLPCRRGKDGVLAFRQAHATSWTIGS